MTTIKYPEKPKMYHSQCSAQSFLLGIKLCIKPPYIFVPTLAFYQPTLEGSHPIVEKTLGWDGFEQHIFNLYLFLLPYM